MSDGVNKNNITSGLFWSYAERILAQLVSLLVSIILARLLEPDHYGMISIVMIFITLCNAFVTGGFGNSLVQKKDADELDFNTMLICSIVVSFGLYAVLYIVAPFIADFYKMPLLAFVIRVLGIRIPISGVNSIQHAKVQKELKFKKFFYATLIGTVISAVVGIVFAYIGFGVWALVAQYLTNTIIDTIVLFITNRWNIKIEFSFTRAKGLLAYGWKVLVTTVVYTIEGDLRSLIIGKVFGSADLAFYDQGKKFPNLIVSNINSSISKVMFPVLSNNQDDMVRLKNMCRRAITIGIFLLSPLLIGLIAVADNFVKIVLTEKWLPCVPYLRILTIVFLVRPLTTTCQQAIMAIGRSDITLKIEIIINVLAIALLCVAVFGFESIILIAWGMVFTEMVSLLLFLYYSRKLIGYRHREQFQDLCPGLGLSTVMGVSVYLIGMIDINQILLLGVQVIIGAVIYILGALLLRLDAFDYLLRMVNDKKENFVCSWMINVMRRN